MSLPLREVVPVEQCYELGARWYADRLTAHWQPKTPVIMRRMFEDVGLRGDFWRID